MADPTAPDAPPAFTGYPLNIVKLNAYAFESAEMMQLPPMCQVMYVHSLCWCRKYGTYTFHLASVSTGQTLAAASRRAARVVSVGIWKQRERHVFDLAPSDLFVPWLTRTDSVVAAEHRRRRAHVSHHHRAELLERDGHQCNACPATDDLTIDHIIPITKGGTDDLDNLRILCRRCNSSKKDRV
jgi:hypothetical protein